MNEQKNLECTESSRLEITDDSRPKRYNQGDIECIEAIEFITKDLPGDRGFLLGNIIKYVWRCNDKGGWSDIQKAKHYANRLVRGEW